MSPAETVRSRCASHGAPNCGRMLRWLDPLPPRELAQMAAGSRERLGRRRIVELVPETAGRAGSGLRTVYDPELGQTYPVRASALSVPGETLRGECP